MELRRTKCCAKAVRLLELTLPVSPQRQQGADVMSLAGAAGEGPRDPQLSHGARLSRQLSEADDTATVIDRVILKSGSTASLDTTDIRFCERVPQHAEEPAASA